MTNVKSKHKIALMLSLLAAALLAIVMAVSGSVISARADDPSWLGGRNVQAEGGHFTLAECAPGEEASKPLGGFELTDTTASETYSFKYNSASGDVNKSGDNWAATADTDATNVPVWTLKIDLAAAEEGKFILPVYYVGGNSVWVMMCDESNANSSSNLLLDGATDNFSKSGSGFRLDATDVSRGSSDTSVVEWTSATRGFSIKANGGGTAYLFGHFWYSETNGRNTVTGSKNAREVSLGDLVIKVIVNAEVKDPVLESASVTVKTESGLGYSLAAAESADYGYELNINSKYKNEYSFQVTYGNDTDSYLLNNDTVNGYGIKEGDYERDSTVKTVADWSGDAAAYTITVPQDATGETVVNCKIWVPAAEKGIFGKIEAKSILLGEFKVKVTVENRDVTNYFKFSDVRQVAEQGHQAHIYGYTMSDVNPDARNMEQFINDSSVSAMFGNIYYKPASVTEGDGYAFTELAAHDLKVNFHVCDDHIEIYLMDTDDRTISFAEGDSITVKKGFRLFERNPGSRDLPRAINSATAEYYDLKQDQEFIFTNGSWSIDQRGITSVSLSATSLAVDKDGSAELTANLVAGPKADTAVTWTVKDETVVSYVLKDAADTHTISITGLKIDGATDITVTTSDGQTAVCEVSVVDPTVVTSVQRVGSRNREVEVGKTITLEVEVVAGSAADKTVTWSSSDTSIAAVSESGVVSGVKASDEAIEITATCGGKSATFNVTVKAGEPTVKPDPDPENPDPTPNPNPSQPADSGKKKGCGSNAAAASAAAAAAVILTGAVALIARRKAYNK